MTARQLHTDPRSEHFLADDVARKQLEQSRSPFVRHLHHCTVAIFSDMTTTLNLADARYPLYMIVG